LTALRFGNTSLVLVIRQRSQRVRNRVARLVVPGLEVGGLGRANTEQHSQDLWMGDAQGQCRAEAAATYLDKGEMECRRVGDRLDVLPSLVNCYVAIVSGDCRKLPLTQVQDRLLERRAVNVRVLSAAAIPRPPAGIDGELHEVSES
jgi:hypothetical protein